MALIFIESCSELPKLKASLFTVTYFYVVKWFTF